MSSSSTTSSSSSSSSSNVSCNHQQHDLLQDSALGCQFASRKSIFSSNNKSSNRGFWKQQAHVMRTVEALFGLEVDNVFDFMRYDLTENGKPIELEGYVAHAHDKVVIAIHYTGVCCNNYVNLLPIIQKFVEPWIGRDQSPRKVFVCGRGLGGVLACLLGMHLYNKYDWNTLPQQLRVVTMGDCSKACERVIRKEQRKQNKAANNNKKNKKNNHRRRAVPANLLSSMRTALVPSTQFGHENFPHATAFVSANRRVVFFNKDQDIFKTAEKRSSASKGLSSTVQATIRGIQTWWMDSNDSSSSLSSPKKGLNGLKEYIWRQGDAAIPDMTKLSRETTGSTVACSEDESLML